MLMGDIFYLSGSLQHADFMREHGPNVHGVGFCEIFVQEGDVVEGLVNPIHLTPGITAITVLVRSLPVLPIVSWMSWRSVALNPSSFLLAVLRPLVRALITSMVGVGFEKTAWPLRAEAPCVLTSVCAVMLVNATALCSVITAWSEWAWYL